MVDLESAFPTSLVIVTLHPVKLNHRLCALRFTLSFCNWALEAAAAGTRAAATSSTQVQQVIGPWDSTAWRVMREMHSGSTALHWG